ncbi:putative ABC transporter permease protein NosY [Sinobacterium norvegicum]|uniref:ABC transporter permease protein NosY n=1 Tax=Sinobacterium norvegicum TaxID=1641715 RepID=A0ABM9AEA3_9GAMM|nr:ABC transporter permease subunit [Sinobacterium norvegicum]CAH0991528.1 putative ABC transporter permease protein NosY [Sinobacterium norvegicum]
MNKIFIVAQKEFHDGIRNRWAGAITLIFILMSLGLAYFGSAAAGVLGFSSLESTLVSLASLSVMLVPLIALMLSYNCFVGELEQGTLLLLMTYPISKAQLLLGKFVGQASIITLASALGFGLPAVIICLISDVDVPVVLTAFSQFIILASLLGWVFIALAYIISVSVTEKSKAAGLALIAWFLSVLVFDLLLMAILVASDGNINQTLVPFLLWVNPTDVFRILVYTVIEADRYSGVLQIATHGADGTAYLIIVMLLWVTLPLLGSWWIFNRKELSE